MQVVTHKSKIKMMPYNSVQMINSTFSLDVFLPRGTLMLKTLHRSRIWCTFVTCSDRGLWPLNWLIFNAIRAAWKSLKKLISDILDNNDSRTLCPCLLGEAWSCFKCNLYQVLWRYNYKAWFTEISFQCSSMEISVSWSL